MPHMGGNLKTPVSFIKGRQEDGQEVSGVRLPAGDPILVMSLVSWVKGTASILGYKLENTSMNQFFLRR